MSPTPKLSVVLPVLNGEKTIAEQLKALARQRDPEIAWEIVVVDNGSTDATASIVRRYARDDLKLRLVDAAREHNLAYARNVGVDAAEGSLIAFCDADDVVADDWALETVRALCLHPFVAFAFEYERLNTAAALVGRSRFQSEGIERFFGLPIASGSLGVNRSVWENVGGNDERWSFTGEDFEFSLRVRQVLGVEPFFAEGAVYHCRLRSGWQPTFRQARRYGRGHVALFRRYVADRPSRSQRLGDAGRAWWWIVTRAPPALVRPRRRQLWARRAGMRVGRAIESVRERQFLP